MKIGIDASRYRDTDATGVEWYSFYIINGLVKAVSNDELVLYSQSPLSVGNAKNKVINCKKLWTLRGLSSEIKNNPVDVLFVPSHVLPLSLPKRSVITIHDVAFKYLRSSYSLKQYLYLDFSCKFAVKNATKIIVPSRATRDDLIHFYGCDAEKISVIYHGFAKPTFSSEEIDDVFEKADFIQHFDLKKDSKYLLFVGRLETKKNLVRLVEAFSEFLKIHSEYKLVLAGKRGLGFDRLLKVVGKLGLIDKVIMPGYVSELEKAALLKYSAAFVFPSLYEGFGLPLLEAFYYKKPVLTSNVSCLPEIGGDSACYVDPYSPIAITNGMHKLITDDTYRNKLVACGLKRLEDFSWEKASCETLKILHG